MGGAVPQPAGPVGLAGASRRPLPQAAGRFPQAMRRQAPSPLPAVALRATLPAGRGGPKARHGLPRYFCGPSYVQPMTLPLSASTFTFSTTALFATLISNV